MDNKSLELSQKIYNLIDCLLLSCISFSSIISHQTLNEATTMEKKVQSYYKYKNDIIFLLAVSGLWPDYKRYPKSIKNLLTFVAVTAEFCTTFGIVNFCYQNLTNINILTRGLGLMISYSSALLKVSAMKIYKCTARHVTVCLIEFGFDYLITDADIGVQPK